MPEIYQKNHLGLLEKAMAREPETISNKERFIFGRTKSGYVFPVLILLKSMKNKKGVLQFMAIFKVDKR